MNIKKSLFTMLTTLAWLYATSQDKPNILVIWGMDIGWSSVSAHNHGMMGYQTPNHPQVQ